MNKEYINFGYVPLAMNIKTLVHTSAKKNFRSYHFHDEIGIIRVESGKLEMTVENENFILNTSDTALINSKIMHRLSPVTVGTKLTYIQINLDMYTPTGETASHLLRFIQKSNCKSHIIEKGEGELGYLFERITEEDKNHKDGYEEYMRGYIHLIIAYMKRNHLINAYSREFSQKLTRLMPAIEYATENFSKNLSIDEISSKINVSKYHFCKLFKSAFGQTFWEYINFVRISMAEEMLLSTNKTTLEIALECGFNSVQYFNRVFAQRYGYSPFRYKKLKKSVISNK